MIAAPLNDHECLAKLTAVAAEGAARADVRAIAARFRTTADLAAWIRSLPQRDDRGDPADGPRVQCDVTQRARLVADDPNCVERALTFVAAAEAIDAGPVRQLATIDTPAGRHTFPVEDGEPVVLDPAIPRNGLRAGLWMIRNGGRAITAPSEADPAALLAWLADVAEDAADERDGEPGGERARRARAAFAALLDGRPITPRDRADALYALRAAAHAATLFGEVGAIGLGVARRVVARLASVATVRARRGQRNVSLGQVVYWGGKAIATYYGMGGLYESAYVEATRPRAPPQAPAAARQRTEPEAPPAMVLGALDEMQPKGG